MDFTPRALASPDLNLANLRTFYYVARYQSFSQAADELSLSQPAVSRQVQSLEGSLGLRLFTSRGRPVVLNEAGRMLFDYAERILRLCDQAQRAMGELSDLRRGHVRLVASTTPGNYLLPAILADFSRRHPGIDVDLVITSSQDALACVADGRADVGVVGMASGQVAGLALEPYAEDEMVLVVDTGHRLAGRKAGPSDLVHETLLMREPGSGTRSAVEAFLERGGWRFKRTVMVGSTEAIKRAVSAGAGLAFLSWFAVREAVSCGTLAVVGGPLIRRTFHIAVPKDERLLPASLALRAFLQKNAYEHQGLS